MAKSKIRERPWYGAFLKALGKGQSPAYAAKSLGLSTSTPYQRRKKDPGFAQAWDEAVHQSAQTRKACKPKARTTQWRHPFLETLAHTSNISAAAERAGISVQTAYALKHSDEKFASQWIAALLEGYQLLEMELLGYIRNPEGSPKMDVANALRLLAAHRETTARERALREDQDEQAVLESIDNFLADMRKRRQANAALLANAKETGPQTAAQTTAQTTQKSAKLTAKQTPPNAAPKKEVDNGTG